MSISRAANGFNCTIAMRILLFKHQREVTMAKLSIKVNKVRCIGSGDCVETAPAVFQLDAEGKSEVIDASAAGDSVIVSAARSFPGKSFTCPTSINVSTDGGYHCQGYKDISTGSASRSRSEAHQQAFDIWHCAGHDDVCASRVQMCMVA